MKKTAAIYNQPVPRKAKSFYAVVIKRLIDIFLSFFAIVVLSPVLLIICFLEMIIHGFPIIYKTKRPGKNAKIFNLYKFRSMTNKRGKDGLLLPESKRLTKFGFFLRKTSLDELPELFNILKGDMSILGPRPLLIEYLNYYSDKHKLRHCVRPGLACVRIVKTESKTWTWREQFDNDIFYVENLSFKTDLKMLFAVIKEVLKGSDYRANDTRVPFNGNNLDDVRTKNELNEDELVHFDSLEGDKK